MATFDDAKRDAADLAKLVNEDTDVTTRYGTNPKVSAPKAIRLIEASGADTVSQIQTDAANAIATLNTSRGFRVVGDFTSGFTYELPNDVAIDASGNYWAYADVNALPITVSAGTIPTEGEYSQRTWNSASAVLTDGGSTVQNDLDVINSYIDKSFEIFESVQDMISNSSPLTGERYSTGYTEWVVTTGSYGVSLGGGYTARPLGWVALEDYGIILDGATDNVAALTLALSHNLPNFINEGYIGTTGLHTFNNHIIGVGSNKCGIRNLDTSANKGWLLTSTSDNLRLKGFSIDGQCSTTANTYNQDPVSWDASNYDTWFGTKSLVIGSSSGHILEDVLCKNSSRGAPFRFESCSNVTLYDCKSERGRGAFGDGFYHVSCKDINYYNCNAKDVTRIGFVSEGDFASATGSSDDVNYYSCVASDGHDASINYGGGEYNSGFWGENTNDYNCTNCKSFDMPYTGFIYAATNTEDSASSATYNHCQTADCPTGFSSSNTGKTGVTDAVITYNDCVASRATTGFSNSGGVLNTNATVNYNRCVAGVSGSGGNSVAFALADKRGTEGTQYNLIDCQSEWGDTIGLANTGINTADISTFDGLLDANVTVKNFTNKTTGKTYIKHRAAGNPTFDISSGSYNVFDTTKGDLSTFSDCTVEGTSTSRKVVLKNATLESTLQVSGEVYGDATINQGRLWVNQPAGSLETKRIVGKLELTVTKDVAVNGDALRLQSEQAIKPLFLVGGSFYNSGAPTSATENFIYVVRSGTQIKTLGALKDNTVVNIYRINTSGGNFATGQEDVTMH